VFASREHPTTIPLTVELRVDADIAAMGAVGGKYHYTFD
jgi:hypothetical protein